jgi:hypothetical protein
MQMFRNDLIKQKIGDETLFNIAVRSGVSTDTVARARDGENLSIKSLAAVASALGLEMRDLFTFEHGGGAGASQADSLSLQN